MIAITGTLIGAQVDTKRIWISIGERGLVSIPFDKAEVRQLAPLVGKELRLTLAEVAADGTAALYGPSERETVR